MTDIFEEIAKFLFCFVFEILFPLVFRVGPNVNNLAWSNPKQALIQWGSRVGRC